MADYTITKALYQSGEISPHYYGRMDSNEYISGAKVMQNSLPDARGGFVKRPGTKFAMNSASKFRTVNFKFGGLNYMVQFFYNNVISLRNVDGSAVSNCADITVSTLLIPQLVDGNTNFAVHKGIIYLVNVNKPVWTCTITESGGVLTISASALTFVDVAPGSDATSVNKFDSVGNYPSAITFKGGRMYLGATADKPSTTWASRTPTAGTDRFNDFTFYDGTISNPTVTASHAIEIAETDNEDSDLLWYITQKKVIAGYQHSIFIETDGWTTPENFDLDIAITEGAANIPAKAYKSYTVFASPNTKKLALMVWDEDLASYTTIDITKNAPHILSAGIKAFDITTSPDPTIWCVLNDGGLAACSINIASGFIAWTYHPRQCGKYLDVLATGEEEHDTLAFMVETEGLSHSKKYSLEIMNLNDNQFGDSYISQSFLTDTVKVKCSEQLENEEELVAWTDKGIVAVSETGEWDSGVYYRTLAVGVRELYAIGLPIKTKVHILPPMLPANGSSMAKIKRVRKISLKYQESYGGTVEVQGFRQDILLEKYGQYEYGSPIEMITDDISVDVTSRNTNDGSIVLLHDEPTPFTILAVTATFEILEA